MIPQRFPEANKVFEKPKGWKEDDCAAVHVCATVNELPSGGKTPCFITAWLPSPEELVKINLGEPIFVLINSRALNIGGMPSLHVVAGSPFVDEKEKEEGSAEKA